MIDFNQIVTVNVFSNNIKHYEEKGYKVRREYIYVNPYTGKKHKRFGVPHGTTIDIPLCDVPKGANVSIKVICDYCGESYMMSYNSYNYRKNNSNILKQACSNCKILKQRDVIRDRYGVENASQLDCIKAKMKNTNLERYGSIAPAGNKEVYQKMKNTMLERYGVDNSMKNPTSLLLAMKNRSITLSENGTIPTSNQQVYINNLLGGELNYPVTQFLADIKLTNNILLEYNGGGHRLSVILGARTDKEFDRKEKAKQHYFKESGFNLITIESRRDYLPSDDIILNMIEYSKQIFSQGRSWIVFDIDESIVQYRYNTKHYDYGNLRKISAEDLKSA